MIDSTLAADQICNGSYYESGCYCYDKETSCELQFWLRGCLPLLISVIGVVLNATTIYIIFPRKPEKFTFKLLLVNLFSWNAIFLLVQVALSIYYIVCKQDYYGIIVHKKVLLPLWNIALSQSIFTVVALSVERYICLVYPSIYERWIAMSKSRLVLYAKYILPFTIFAYLFHLPSFLVNVNEDIWYTRRMSSSYKKCFIFVRKDYEIATIHNTYLRLFIEGILPISLITYCSRMVYIKVIKPLNRRGGIRNLSELYTFKHHEETEMTDSRTKSFETKWQKLKHTSKTTEYRLAKGCIRIALLFIICQAPIVIFRFCESIYLGQNQHCYSLSGQEVYPFGVFQLELFANLMLILNASFNVIVLYF